MSRRVWRVEDDLLAADDRGRYLFGCRAVRMVARQALELPEEGLESALRRRIELVSCLANPADERFTYDLRVISRPDAAMPWRGTVELAVLCRAEGLAGEEARRAAGDLLHLLQTTLVEVDWEAVRGGELHRLARPFAARHVVGVVRRAGWLRLDSLGVIRRSAMGFVRTEAEVEEPVGAAFHVFPFVPTFPGHGQLLRRLLLHPEPVMLSCRLRPTRLTEGEAAFLERQIEVCERHAQLHLGSVTDVGSALRPTLQRRAHLLEQHLMRALHALLDDAALLALDIASPRPIPRMLAESVAHAVSQPASAARPGPSAGNVLELYLAGGYDLLERPRGYGRVLERIELDPGRDDAVPPEAGRLRHLFEPGEAVAAFRVPFAPVEGLPGLPCRRVRYRVAPAAADREGVLLGTSGRYGGRQEVRLGREDRLRHLYVVGQTGTGKTTLLRTMILDDLRSGAGLCLIDPHGDLYAEVLGLIPEERIGDVVLLDPSDPDGAAALNILERKGDEDPHLIVQDIVGIVERLMVDRYGQQHGMEMLGPVFFQHLTFGLLLLISHPSRQATLQDVFELFMSRDAWQRWARPLPDDPVLRRWVEQVLRRTNYTARDEDSVSLGEYVGSKLQDFIFVPALRQLFGAPRSSFDLRELMDTGGVLLVNLAKGKLTEPAARFLGMVLLGRMTVAAMSRVHLEPQRRRPFTIYVDEFHALTTTTFNTLLSEGRKFGIGLVLANQFVSQLRARGIDEAIFGNVGTIVAFRTGVEDARRLAPRLEPAFRAAQLAHLPNWHAVVAGLRDGAAMDPFVLETVAPRERPSRARARAVRRASARGHRQRLWRALRELNLAAAARRRGRQDDG